MGAERHRQRTADRKMEAWRLRVQGWTQARIADELKMTQQAVSQLLKKTETELAAEFLGEAAEIKARQTAQLEAVYEEAMDQWRRSCEDAERNQVVSGRVKATDMGLTIDLPDLVTKTTEGQSGNPALLEKAMKALADIRAIWGLDAPQKKDVTSGGEPFKVYAGFDPEAV